jgi:hypothetical protein
VQVGTGILEDEGRYTESEDPDRQIDKEHRPPGETPDISGDDQAANDLPDD